MSGTTSKFAIPYPDSDDPIAEGAETIRQGMERTDRALSGDLLETFGSTVFNISGTGFGKEGIEQAAWRDGRWVSVYAELSRPGSPLAFNSSGGISDTAIVQLDHVRLRSMRPVPVDIIYRSGGPAGTHGGLGWLYNTGTIVLVSGLPNTEVSSTGSGGGWALFFHFTFLARDV